MAWHSKGSVSVTLNSEAVLGNATDFIANVRTGDAFRGPDGRWYEITNVTSATVISIKPNYQGATASGQVYAVVPIHGYSKNLADQFRDINNQWGATLAGIKPWAVSSTGQQAQADMGISAVGRALNNASTPANALSYLGGRRAQSDGLGWQRDEYGGPRFADRLGAIRSWHGGAFAGEQCPGLCLAYAARQPRLRRPAVVPVEFRHWPVHADQGRG